MRDLFRALPDLRWIMTAILVRKKQSAEREFEALDAPVYLGVHMKIHLSGLLDYLIKVTTPRDWNIYVRDILRLKGTVEGSTGV